MVSPSTVQLNGIVSDVDRQNVLIMCGFCMIPDIIDSQTHKHHPDSPSRPVMTSLSLNPISVLSLSLSEPRWPPHRTTTPTFSNTSSSVSVLREWSGGLYLYTTVLYVGHPVAAVSTQLSEMLLLLSLHKPWKSSHQETRD